MWVLCAFVAQDLRVVAGGIWMPPISQISVCILSFWAAALQWWGLLYAVREFHSCVSIVAMRINLSETSL